MGVDMELLNSQIVQIFKKLRELFNFRRNGKVNLRDLEDWPVFFVFHVHVFKLNK